jgi:ribonuclease D
LPALPAVIPGPLTRDQQALYKKLRKRLVAVAEARGIPIELLAPRRRLEAMIQQAAMGEDPCNGGLFEEQWRRELLEPLQDDIRGILTP